MSGWQDLLRDGRAAHRDLVAEATLLRGEDDERVIRVRLAGGVSFDALVDHGLDIGPAWYGGIPVAWRSALPVDPGAGADWESRFRGGLLVTCGPDNIGEPRAGAGQHGTHHHTPASDVRIERQKNDGEISVRLTGSIAHLTLGGPRIIIEREITASTGGDCVAVRDTVRNVGTMPVSVPLLYHANFGAPLVVPGAVVVSGATSTVTREPLPPGREASVIPDVAPHHVPVVAEHRSSDWDRADQAWAEATLQRGDKPRVRVRWMLATLPRLNTWVFPATGTWVLGIEPSNAPLFGPERESDNAGAPTLAPGASWECGVEISFPGVPAPNLADL